MQSINKLKHSARHPTSIIFRGEDLLGIEIAKSLLEQGGAVIIVDKGTKEVDQYMDILGSYELLMLIDYSGIEALTRDLRRLDYVFYLNHQLINFENKISTQTFLQASNYLDSILDLTAKFDAKFLLSTSIKAHQQVLAQKNFDFNFNPNVEENYSLYTELDIQRYSESLVKEYQEKVGIDARIVRLGTLLGKGMELNVNSELIKMIISAIKAEPLLVQADGLESDYYIHYLDAAYGIIKAQFTPNTKGRIFSLVNEEEITLLSVAYKLLEIYPKCQEIKFNSDDNSLPSLKLYKPAPNLSSIGWQPRVPFERALTQTVSYLEENISKISQVSANSFHKGVIPLTRDKPKTFRQKIIDFFFVREINEADATKHENLKEINTQGALARLIAERKSQDNARRGNIILANNNIRKSIDRNYKKNIFVKIDDGVNSLFLGLKRKFEFLKNMTLLDLFFLILGIICLGLLYFQLVSPGLSFVKNLYIISENLKGINLSVSQLNFEETQKQIIVVKTNAVEAQQRLNELEYIFILLQKPIIYKNTQILIADFIQYTSAQENIYSGLIPLGKYLDEYKPNILYRYDSSKYLTVENNSNFKIYLEKISKNKTLLDIGNNTLQKSKEQLVTKLNEISPQISQFFLPQIQQINTSNEQAQMCIKGYEYLPFILGKDANRKVSVLMQDNLVYSDGGGAFVGYMIFNIKDGVINEVKVVNLTKYLDGLPIVSETTIDNLKFTTNRQITANNIKVRDLSLMMDKKLMYSEMQKVIEGIEGIKIDLLINLNTGIIKQLLSDSEIVINNVKINGENYVNAINTLVGDVRTSEQRNDVLINIFSQLIAKQSESLKSVKTQQLISSWFSSDLIHVYSNNTTINKYLSNIDNSITTPEKYFIGVNNNELNITPKKIPLINLSGKITFKNDMSSEKNFNINLNGLDNLYNATFCNDGASKNYNFSGVAGINYTQIFSPELNKNCVLFMPDDDLKYGIGYIGLPFDKEYKKGYNKKIQFDSALGVEVVYDIEVVFEDSTLTIETENKEAIKEGNAFIFRGLSTGSQQFIFNFR